MERNQLIELVTRVQRGDSAAMDELFAAFYNDVYYFALKTVKNSNIACDITQETFLEIIHTIGSLKEPAAFVTWMKRITYHQCTRYFKKKKDVLLEEDENTVFDTLSDESEGAIPAEVYEKEEFRSMVMDIVNELSEEQRSAVMMYYFDELSTRQIAQIQDVSEGTVKSRLNYARKALKKSVEGYEKKHGIKLRSFSFGALFLLFFGKRFMPVAKAAGVRQVVSEAAKSMGIGTAVAAESTAAVGAAGTGLFAKVAAMPVAAKILAGVAAVTVIAGVGFAVIPERQKPVETEHVGEDINGDCICDCSEECDIEVHYFPAGEHIWCMQCGVNFFNYDLDANHICDLCGEYRCGPSHQEPHAYENGVCRFCGGEEPHEHSLIEGCVCEGCGEVLHEEGQTHPFCGNCGQRLPISDGDGDGACDICGEFSCGGQNHGGNTHADDNGDGKCDTCAGYMCGLVWGSAEHNFDYSDGIYDGLCDNCGSSPYAMGYWEEEGVSHADEDADGICECCDRDLCHIFSRPEFGGVDENGDEKCDICGFILCDGHGDRVYHYDFDGDAKCDRCDHFICIHGYMPHTDEDGDGICDNCRGYV